MYHNFILPAALSFLISVNSFAQIIPGCNSLDAINYSPIVNFNDGSCLYDDPCGNIINEFALGYGFFATKHDYHWAKSFDSGNGSANFAGHQLILTGSELGVIQDVWTQVYMPVPISGIYSFDWQYATEDYSPFVDPALYIVDGNYILLSEYGGGNVQNGSVSFFANEGQFIGWLVRSTDSVGGSAQLIISNFNYPVECVIGCTYSEANNYYPTATFDDGTCIFEPAVSCTADLNNDMSVNSGDLLLLLSAYGTSCL